jgi:predicted TIM-barrel fold metal-dependent hydrolase
MTAELYVIDAHCHVPSVRYTPRSFIEASVRNVSVMMEASGLKHPFPRLLDRYLGLMQDHQGDGLVGQMDAAGISTTVLLCPDFSYALKDCVLTAEEALLEHRAILQRHPGRFEAFAGVDPRWGADGIDLFERAVAQWGFRGLKIYPPCGYTASDPGLFPYYEICAQRRLPVMVHTGPTSPALCFHTSRPFDLDAAARRFERVNFILAHASIAFPEECVMMAAFRTNVYLDISGFQKNLISPCGKRDLERVLSGGVPHKILFGTDWPVFRELGSLSDAVQATRAADNPLADLPDPQLALLLGGNAARLLGLRSASVQAGAAS